MGPQRTKLMISAVKGTPNMRKKLRPEARTRLTRPGQSFGILSTCILSMLVGGCTDQAKPPVAETPPPKVTVSQPIERQIRKQDEYTGQIEATETVEIRPRVRGHIVKIAFTAGSEVKKDDVLFEIDPRPYKATVSHATAMVAAAKATLKLQDAQLKREMQLYERRVGSREELDITIGKQAVAAAEVSKAEAALEQANLDLDFTKITAPIAGRVGRELVTVGNLVASEQTLLTTIVSVDPVHIYFDVDEPAMLRYRDWAKTQKGSIKPEASLKEAKIPVSIGLVTEQGFPHQGMLDFSDNRLDTATMTIRARGVISNADRTFSPGLFSRVRIAIDEPRKALLVTERAIGIDQSLKYLFVVNEQNEVERREIRQGIATDDGLAAIEVGLKPGEWVIVNGVQRVRPGVKVDPVKVEMPVLPQLASATPKPSVASSTKSDSAH